MARLTMSPLIETVLQLPPHLRAGHARPVFALVPHVSLMGQRLQGDTRAPLRRRFVHIGRVEGGGLLIGTMCESVGGLIRQFRNRSSAVRCPFYVTC